jgi:hypothetical protein
MGEWKKRLMRKKEGNKGRKGGRKMGRKTEKLSERGRYKVGSKEG